MYKILNQQFTYIDLYTIVPLIFNAFPRSLHLIYRSWMYIVYYKSFKYHLQFWFFEELLTKRQSSFECNMSRCR